MHSPPERPDRGRQVSPYTIPTRDINLVFRPLPSSRPGVAAEHPDDGFVLGVLYGIERCEADAALTGIEEAWAEATDPAGLELIAR